MCSSNNHQLIYRFVSVRTVNLLYKFISIQTAVQMKNIHKIFKNLVWITSLLQCGNREQLEDSSVLPPHVCLYDTMLSCKSDDVLFDAGQGNCVSLSF